jgi:hypothetical protein
MKDELVNKSALASSALDQVAAAKKSEGDVEGAETAQKLADGFADLANKTRGIIERINRRIDLLDEFAESFHRDNSRYPTPEEQREEMTKRGFMKDGEWTI